MYRGTLTSPNQILLDHAILSPVDPEFVIMGRKEYLRECRQHWISGWRIGAICAFTISVIITLVGMWVNR